MDNRFPHIYGAINTSAVIKAADFPHDDQGFWELFQESADLNR